MPYLRVVSRHLWSLRAKTAFARSLYHSRTTDLMVALSPRLAFYEQVGSRKFCCSMCVSGYFEAVLPAQVLNCLSADIALPSGISGKNCSKNRIWRVIHAAFDLTLPSTWSRGFP